jgi:hypothetical protein
MATTNDAPNYQPSIFERALIRVFHFIDPIIPWHKFPGYIGLVSLGIMRTELRAKNLYDGYASGAVQGNATEDAMDDPRFKNARNSDGKFNSLEQPLMGCAGMRFGRSFPRKYTEKPTEEMLYNPSPRLVSERFMARKPGTFFAAASLNLLAAAWIQFQTRELVGHLSWAVSYC